jgi:hypothetical protein
LQDEAQQFHWNNAQVTVHQSVIYFKKSDAEHENLVMISDCLNHDSNLVLTFQWHLMKFIENTFESPLRKLLILLWVCSPIQDRKNLLNIACNNEDFGVPAEWHFFVISHGKSACDGVGGTVKKCLQQKPVCTNHIM